jgi:phosphomannomutase
MDPSIFKAYDIRGLYQEQLDEQAAWKIGHATAQFLRSMVHGYNRGLPMPKASVSAGTCASTAPRWRPP